MLVEFRVRNFRSFRDEQVLSLVAGRDATLRENCIEQGRLRLLRAQDGFANWVRLARRGVGEDRFLLVQRGFDFAEEAESLELGHGFE